MVLFENVSKIYGKSNVKAVDDLTLELRPGEIYGFLGPFYLHIADNTPKAL